MLEKYGIIKKLENEVSNLKDKIEVIQNEETIMPPIYVERL